MADAMDSKSIDRKVVRVRLSPRAPRMVKNSGTGWRVKLKQPFIGAVLYSNYYIHTASFYCLTNGKRPKNLARLTA